MKRLFDILLAGVLALVLVPFFLILIVLIRLESPGKAIFRQPRVGRGGKLFTLYKFRTMHQDTPQVPSCDLCDYDKHLLRTGRILRNFSLDETLQLLNILKGDMSFVGPRPVIPEETDLIKARQELGVYQLKPGVTGWAQINGRNRVTPREKAQLDAYYLHHRSLIFDLKIMVKTFAKVMTKEGVVAHRWNEKQSHY